MEQLWNRNGIDLEQIWNRYGAVMEQKWYIYGIDMDQIWNLYGIDRFLITLRFISHIRQSSVSYISDGIEVCCESF